MPVTIINRFTCAPIATVEDTDDIREAVSQLVKRGENLSGADLSGANLAGANLAGANLTRANLAGANLDDTTRLETGETWKEYCDEVLPKLLTGGGKTR
jgi:hypothetical protein